MITRRFTVTVAYSRMTWSGDSSGETSRGTFLAHVQQASPETAKFVGEALGKVFTLWCPEATAVALGDSLTVSDGSYAGTYSLKATQLNAVGGQRHLELTAVKDI